MKNSFNKTIFLVLIGLSFLMVSQVAEAEDIKNDDVLLMPAKVEMSLDPGESKSVMLTVINRSNKKVSATVSAEDFLLKNNPEQWEHVIEEAYNSEFMKKRISLEQQGVSQIKLGTYIFK